MLKRAVINEEQIKQLVAQRAAVKVLCDQLGLDHTRVKRIHLDVNAVEFDAPAAIIVEYLLYDKDIQTIISTIRHFKLVPDETRQDIEHREHVGPLQ